MTVLRVRLKDFEMESIKKRAALEGKTVSDVTRNFIKNGLTNGLTNESSSISETEKILKGFLNSFKEEISKVSVKSESNAGENSINSKLISYLVEQVSFISRLLSEINSVISPSEISDKKSAGERVRTAKITSESVAKKILEG
jgi:hypothetical protein